MKPLQLIQGNIDQIRQIATRHGASDVRIFGSVARGDDRADSDVDLVVRFESHRTLLNHGAMQVELEDLLGFKVDVISEAGLKGRFREQVLREAIAI